MRIGRWTAGINQSSFRVRIERPERCDRFALILQGGSALAAYQAATCAVKSKM